MNLDELQKDEVNIEKIVSSKHWIIFFIFGIFNIGKLLDNAKNKWNIVT